MNLLLRLAWIVVRWVWRKPTIYLLDTSCVPFLVFPNDLDPYGHMNNGRYLTLMDLGRLDLMLRTRMWKITRAQKWNPLIGASWIIHKKPLLPFQRFALKTTVTTWDEKWFYMEQRFERKGQTYAQGFVKGLFRGPDGNVPTAVLLKAMGLAAEPKQDTAYIAQWLAAEKSYLEQDKSMKAP